MPTNEKYNVNEGNDFSFPFVLEESTDGETLSGRIRATDGSGTGTSVGTVAGAVADTQLTVTLAISGQSPDEYNLEIWADYGGAGERLVYPPSGDTTIIINIVDRFGVTN